MDVDTFLAFAEAVWQDAQAHASEVEPLLIAPSNRGLLNFAIVNEVSRASHVPLMREGCVPMVNPAKTHPFYRPYFEALEITCGVLVSPATVLDVRLRTHVHALTAVLHHREGLEQNLWGVRMLDDGSCEPMPALDHMSVHPLSVDWMKELMA